MKRQISIFAAVGVVAALVHLTVVALLVETWRWPALTANVGGFAVAFIFSFGGHARWTFPLAAAQRTLARRRFFLVALTGFAVNQSAYASGLEALGAAGSTWYLPLLAAVLLSVAALTFILSRLWAFAQPQPAPRPYAAPDH